MLYAAPTCAERAKAAFPGADATACTCSSLAVREGGHVVHGQLVDRGGGARECMYRVVEVKGARPDKGMGG